MRFSRMFSVVAVLSCANAAWADPPVQFNAPVRVTPGSGLTQGYGYEPAVYSDRFGNLFATAHKENYQLVVGPDSNSPAQTRSMSWAWISSDGGQSWQDLAGLTGLSLEQHQFGDEGDMALDDAGHLYFVDTNVVDNTITRWSIQGLGRVSLDFTRPVIPTGQAVDDRPWVTAHGDGVVFYTGNTGDGTAYPIDTLPNPGGDGFGRGRFIVYTSRDGGRAFDPVGYPLKDSGWCRLAADHTPGSKYMYVVCTAFNPVQDILGGTPDPNDPEAKAPIYVYVTADDGKTFNRHVVGSYHYNDSTSDWPSVVVDRDGSIWTLYIDGDLDSEFNVVSNRLMLYHSTDHGQTWTSQDITPEEGRYQFGWLTSSNTGKYLGIGVYHGGATVTGQIQSPTWGVYGGIFKPQQPLALTRIQETNRSFADLMGAAFLPDNTLEVLYTTTATSGAPASRDIRAVRSVRPPY